MYIKQKTIPITGQAKLKKIQTLLNIWKMRNLTIFKKLTIIKQLAISKILSSALGLPVPEGTIEEINSIF